MLVQSDDWFPHRVERSPLCSGSPAMRGGSGIRQPFRTDARRCRCVPTHRLVTGRTHPGPANDVGDVARRRHHPEPPSRRAAGGTQPNRSGGREPSDPLPRGADRLRPRRVPPTNSAAG